MRNLILTPTPILRPVHVSRVALPLTMALYLSCAYAIDLADYPPFSTVKVPGNLALVLSVEYPTATSMAYISAYATDSTYIGYFNPEMCYTYVYNASSPTSSYFKPVSVASSHVCDGKWSGNYMNWMSMQTLDEFRWIMTGGYRSVDTATGSETDTILTKTYSANTVSNKSITGSALASGATPLSWNTVKSRTGKLGSRVYLTRSGNLNTTTPVDYQNQSEVDDEKVYQIYINVAVCTSAATKEDNCVAYPNNGTPVYKPEGLMQRYSMQLRYAAFGYLNDSSPSRDGGVLRARMNYIGPTQPVPGSNDIVNTGSAEWSATTGVMLTNPAAADATATNTEFGLTTVTNSGAMNYLNKFGYTAQGYKSYDPVSELYYTAFRYYRGLGNVDTYTSGATAAHADGFPVITKWRKTDSDTLGADPIVYSCQKNFILGIGDVNAHRDVNLPGSSLAAGSLVAGYEPAMPADVSADTDVNVTTATNMVGQLEGASTNLGDTYVNSGRKPGYYIAGMAYHAHTIDIRPTLTGASLSTDTDMSGMQTINTYWLDVLEKQEYMRKNQYWLAAKYGGFTVPNGFSPYSTGNGTGTLSDNTWHTTPDTSAGMYSALTASGASFSTSSGTAEDKRPDNYFFGSNPAAMKSGLTAAFNKISSELGAANSTAYAMASPNVISGDASYAAAYDPVTWTSSLSGYLTTYGSNGSPTTTVQWNARDLLESLSTPATTRKVVTYCDAGTTPGGIPFTASSLASCPSSGRLNYASFANISGATSSSATSQADYVAYLRGSRTNELSTTTTSDARIYRRREYLLGDIVGSKITTVGAPNRSYYDLYNPGYSAYKQTYENRRTVVYAGSNDGMLHAFDGLLPGYTKVISTNTITTSSCTFCGQERFGFIPSFVYGSAATAATSGLASLGSPTRSHYYMVNATPLSFDVDLNKVCSASTRTTTAVCDKVGTTPDWRTLLIGGLGKGGKGFYAIDVTNPGTVTTASSTTGGVTTVTKTVTDGDWDSESAIASKVLWEFPRSDDSTTIARMGYSFGAPSVVKTPKYGWVVVFTSGYNNSDGKGYLFFVNPRSGALLETVSTTVGSTSAPINLAQIDAYIPNHADFTADALYGGDMQGNLWRWDLTSSTATYTSPLKLATLYKTAGTAQPVTTRPLIEIDPITGKRYVLVGTGRLLADSDSGSSATQSIYSIYDGGKAYGGFRPSSDFATPLSQATLEQNASMLNGIGSTPTSSDGWYFDLSSIRSASNTNATIAERVNVDPVAYNGMALFGVNVPNGSVCAPSGNGYILAFGIGNARTVLQDANGDHAAKSDNMRGIITDIAVQNVNGTVRAVAGDSTGAIVVPPAQVSSASGIRRMSWREIPTQ